MVGVCDASHGTWYCTCGTCHGIQVIIHIIVWRTMRERIDALHDVACGMWHDVASTLELASNREVPWYHHEYNNQQYCTLVCADKKIASY